MSQRDQEEFYGSNRPYCICCILPRAPMSRFSNTLMIYISDILHNHCIRRCFHMQQPLYRGKGVQEIRRSSSCLYQFSMFDFGRNRRGLDLRCCSPLYSSARSSSWRKGETALSRPSRIPHIHVRGGSIWPNYKAAVRERETIHMSVAPEDPVDWSCRLDPTGQQTRTEEHLCRGAEQLAAMAEHGNKYFA